MQILQKLVIIISTFIILFGLAGMFYCLPFLYSSRIEDLVGAGFPFISGSIMITGGTVSLAILTNKKG